MLQYGHRLSGVNMQKKLSIAFIWHMHQPVYKSDENGIFLMPWVRLRAVKDYLDMWLQEHMTVVGRSNYGKTAKQSYRKALYMFFIFIINYIAKV